MGVEPLSTSRRSARANESALMETGLNGFVNAVADGIVNTVANGFVNSVAKGFVKVDGNINV